MGGPTAGRSSTRGSTSRSAETATGATTRLRPTRGAGRPGDGAATSVRSARPTPATQSTRVNSRYDTADQAALRRVDVRERTADATVYHKVAPAARAVGARDVGAGPDELDERGPIGRRAGATRATRSTGPRPGQGKRGPRWWRNRPRWFRRLVLISMLSGTMLFVAGIAVIYAATQVPLPAEVKTDQTSIITYAEGPDGQAGGEIARVGTVNRTDVPLAQVSKDVQHAVLAAENKNFYNEPGISLKGIARALWVNVTGGGIQQGGSTITQQYAKNAYLTQERTFTRKMREIVLAVKLDQKYSKDQILEFYLNTIYFGRGAYGIEAAANTYFGKPAADLNAAEGAVIAGLIRSPNQLDPMENPGPAEARWSDVVSTMIAEGWAPASLASEKPPAVLPKADSASAPSYQAAYIRERVKYELEQAGISEDQINRGGLRIMTTLDEGRQTAAFQAVNGQISDAYAAVPDLRTGLVAIKPGTGEVLAWYGGSLYGEGTNGQEQYEDNVYQAAVPPGSTFKTVTLVAALREGISLRSTYEAKPTETIGDYTFGNDESEPGHLGWPDLVKATADSINTVYVPLGVDVGVDKVIQTAHEMGVDAELQNYAGVSLGQDSVTALDMTEVYGTLASGGYRATPHIVDKVVDGTGKTIFQGGDADEMPVISPAVAHDATYALQSVVKEGTGKNAALASGRPAAGKTGTTDNFRSAWFCGYTKEIASCVNMFRGRGTEAEQLKGIPGAQSGVYGGSYPAKIWKAFMDAALQGVPPSQFDPPAYGGIVTERSPSPSPTPSETPSLTPSQDGEWDLFGDDRDNGGQQNQRPGGPQPTRPPRSGGLDFDGILG